MVLVLVLLYFNTGSRLLRTDEFPWEFVGHDRRLSIDGATVPACFVSASVIVGWQLIPWK